MPLVSVAIPTHNRLALLKEAVVSATTQTFESWELLVVDDGSSDGTSDYLRALEDERVRAFRFDDPRERSAARNRALEEASGEFVLFLDDDDLLEPRALERLISPLQSRADCVAVIGARVTFDQAGQRRRISHPHRVHRGLMWKDILAGWMVPPGQCLMRTQTVREVGGWRDEFIPSEDQELLLKLAYRGSFCLISSIVLYQRKHVQSVSNRDHVEDELRRRFVISISPEDREQATQGIEARRLLGLALRHATSHDYRSALHYQAQLMRSQPSILRSPVLGSYVGRGLFRFLIASVLTPGIRKAVRRLKRLARLALRRDVAGHRHEGGHER